MAKLEPIFCDNLGDTSSLQCCYPNDQDGPVCRRNFNNQNATLFIDHKGEYLGKYCWNVHDLYSSKIADDAAQGSGVAPRRRYLACANVPNMARYLHDEILNPSISAEVGRYITSEFDDQVLKNVTFAVTECLTATCRNARNSTLCQRRCSGVNHLVDSTTPSMQGLDSCLDTLCTGKYDSLPYADADVAGIGVFASYILQCVFVIILLFGLTILELCRGKSNLQRLEHTDVVTSSDVRGERESTRSCVNIKERGSKENTREVLTHQGIFIDFLVDFHKSQCFFSTTIQIASLTYGIFDINILDTFLLIPLATNGVLPVVFSYMLLLRCRKASLDTTVFTTVCWLLASLVYWILYSHIISINEHISDDQKRYRAYQQFSYKLSALDECGGYSALAVCPGNFNLPKNEVVGVSKKLRKLTPIVWTFSTVLLLVALGEKFRCWRSRRKYETLSHCSGGLQTHHGTQQKTSARRKDLSSSFLNNEIVYWPVVLCFLAGTGIELSLLSVSISLNMIKKQQWSFGQIIAVTVWVPSIMGCLFGEWDKKRRDAQAVKSSHKQKSTRPEV